MIDFSIIIPQRGAFHTLPRLFDSIPMSDRIEIILVDNSPIPVTKDEIGIDRAYQLYWSNPNRHAGGARNVGIEHAKGKWLIFADADDYFAEGAFDAFYKHLGSPAEMIYFCMGGIYEDTGERSNRGDNYTNLVKNFKCGDIDELHLRLSYSSPCAKMVSHTLVDRHNIRYDEVLASNDTYFSMLTGYYAAKVETDSTEVYIATVSRGSLTRRRDFAVVLSRYKVALRFNKFLKEHGLGDRQKSVMVYFYNARAYGFKALLKMLGLAIEYRQNPFIGMSRWINTLNKTKKLNEKESKYITK